MNTHLFTGMHKYRLGFRLWMSGIRVLLGPFHKKCTRQTAHWPPKLIHFFLSWKQRCHLGCLKIRAPHCISPFINFPIKKCLNLPSTWASNPFGWGFSPFTVTFFRPQQLRGASSFSAPGLPWRPMSHMSHDPKILEKNTTSPAASCCLAVALPGGPHRSARAPGSRLVLRQRRGDPTCPADLARGPPGDGAWAVFQQLDGRFWKDLDTIFGQKTAGRSPNSINIRVYSKILGIFQQRMSTKGYLIIPLKCDAGNWEETWKNWTIFAVSIHN